MRAPAGSCTARERPVARSWKVMLVLYDARVALMPLVRGLMRKPASRSSGSDMVAMPGSPSRPSSASVCWSRPTSTPGVGCASMMAGMGAGGVR